MFLDFILGALPNVQYQVSPLKRDLRYARQVTSLRRDLRRAPTSITTIEGSTLRGDHHRHCKKGSIRNIATSPLSTPDWFSVFVSFVIWLLSGISLNRCSRTLGIISEPDPFRLARPLRKIARFTPSAPLAWLCNV